MKNHRCWKCWAYAAWWLLKGVLFGWAVCLLHSRRMWNDRRWKLDIAWMIWKEWYWPFYSADGWDLGCRYERSKA